MSNEFNNYQWDNTVGGFYHAEEMARFRQQKAERDAAHAKTMARLSSSATAEQPSIFSATPDASLFSFDSSTSGGQTSVKSGVSVSQRANDKGEGSGVVFFVLAIIGMIILLNIGQKSTEQSAITKPVETTASTMDTEPKIIPWDQWEPGKTW